MMRKRFFVLFFSVVLAGCGGDAEDQAVATTPFNSVSPVQDFMVGSDLKGNVATIQESRVADCMRKQGWNYEPSITAESATPQEPTNPQALIEWRKKYGYGYLNSPPQADSSKSGRAAADRQETYRQSLSSDARSRYMKSLGYGLNDEEGHASSGCRGEVENELKASFPEFNRAITDDVIKQQQAMSADSAYAEASKKWAECMNKAGFEYQNAGDARQEISNHFEKGENTSELRARELKVASADANCSLDTVWKTRWQLETKLIQGIVDKYGKAATCRDKC